MMTTADGARPPPRKNAKGRVTAASSVETVEQTTQHITLGAMCPERARYLVRAELDVLPSQWFVHAVLRDVETADA